MIHKWAPEVIDALSPSKFKIKTEVTVKTWAEYVAYSRFLV